MLIHHNSWQYSILYLMLKHLLFIGFMLINGSLFACDSCGNSGMSSTGILMGLQNNTFGLQYRFAHFESAPNMGSSSDYFHQLDLSGSLFVNPRWKVGLSVPIKYNYRLQQGIRQPLSGIGDAVVLNTLILFNNKPLKKNRIIYLDVGLGVQMPTGNYNPNIHQEGLPENFNLGKGNWGMLLRSNVQYKKDRFGLVLINAFLANSKTNIDYLFGHQFNSSLSLFYKILEKDDFHITPYIGGSFESIRTDLYADNNKVHGTGGTGLLGTVGCQVGLSNLVIGAGIQQPIYQSFAQDEVLAKGRLSFDLTILF